VRRLLNPEPTSNGRPWGEGVESTEAAERALYVKLGLLAEPETDRGVGVVREGDLTDVETTSTLGVLRLN
jgi:hypothetical protein